MRIASLGKVERKIAASLFNKGFRIGFAMLFSDMVQSGPFVRQTTSTAFEAICQEVVLKSTWVKRRQFHSSDEILNYTLSWSIFLTEREIDRQQFFAKLLAFTWRKHNAGDYRIVPISEFILMLARKYDTREITNQVQIPITFGDRLIRDSFERIRLAGSGDAEFIALWDQVRDGVLSHSREQAL